MRSAAQSEATVLNEAEIAYFAGNVQFWAARIARTHDDTRALLSLKRRLRHSALDCACSHVTLHDGATDVRDEDVRQALARVRARLLSERARHDAEQNLLASEQRQQEQWRRESPSTDALYKYIVCLADMWLHSLAQPVNTAVGTATQLGQLQEKWQAHAKTARQGRARCRQLRQQLLHDEPAAVEAKLCEVAAEQQRSAQEDKRTEPAAGTEVHGQQRLPTPDPVRSTDASTASVDRGGEGTRLSA